MTDTKALTFKKGNLGRYRANGADASYVIRRDAYGSRTVWTLLVFTQDRSISDLVLLGEKVDEFPLDRLTDAKAVAAEYEALGADYRSCDHGYANRLTVAINRAFDAMA